MADTLIVRSEDIFARVGGRRLTAFPVAGNYIDIEKASAKSTPTEGQHGNLIHVRTNGRLYTVTFQIMPGTGDDAWLAATIAAQDALPGLLIVSIEWSGAKWSSNSCDMSVVPTRSLAGDSAPPIAYACSGAFPIAIVKAFQQPPVLTEEQISSFIPA
jgi:hypothetical protein